MRALPVGELQARVGIPPATLSHHILFLITVGLVKQQRDARGLRCRPNFDLMHAVVEALQTTQDRPTQARQGRRPPRSARNLVLRFQSSSELAARRCKLLIEGRQQLSDSRAALTPKCAIALAELCDANVGFATRGLSVRSARRHGRTRSYLNCNLDSEIRIF